MDGKSPATEELTYRVLGTEDQDIVVKFIQEHFIPHEPLCIAAGINPEEEKIFPHVLIKNSLWQGVSIGVFDNSTGELCAARVNILSKNSGKLPETEDLSKISAKLQSARRILSAVKGEGLEENLGTKHFMEHLFVAVSQSHAKQGIASELYRQSETLAREHGCDKMVATCSSVYTKRSVEKAGYVKVNEITYEEYVDPCSGVKLFTNVKSPHKTVSLMVKSL